MIDRPRSVSPGAVIILVLVIQPLANGWVEPA